MATLAATYAGVKASEPCRMAVCVLIRMLYVAREADRRDGRLSLADLLAYNHNRRGGQ
jgi:hypothetical protein